MPVKVHWDPYFLDSTTPKEGRDLQEYLSSKYGAAAVARFSGPDNPLDNAGRRVGIEFNKSRRIVNTVDSHRIMEWCNDKHPEKADGLMDKLFKAYFVEAKDVSDHSVLSDICVTEGLDAAEVQDILRTGMATVLCCVIL